MFRFCNMGPAPLPPVLEMKTRDRLAQSLLRLGRGRCKPRWCVGKRTSGATKIWRGKPLQTLFGRCIIIPRDYESKRQDMECWHHSMPLCRRTGLSHTAVLFCTHLYYSGSPRVFQGRIVVCCVCSFRQRCRVSLSTLRRFRVGLGVERLWGLGGWLPIPRGRKRRDRTCRRRTAGSCVFSSWRG